MDPAAAIDLADVDLTEKPDLYDKDSDVLCPDCKQWLCIPLQYTPGDVLTEHLMNKNHRKNSLRRGLRRADTQVTGSGAPGMFFHTLDMVYEDYVHSLVLQVYDAGGTEVGTIQLSPYARWPQIVFCWWRETLTMLLTPEGVHLHTIAAELHDEILTAIVIVRPDWSKARNYTSVASMAAPAKDARDFDG